MRCSHLNFFPLYFSSNGLYLLPRIDFIVSYDISFYRSGEKFSTHSWQRERNKIILRTNRKIRFNIYLERYKSIFELRASNLFKLKEINKLWLNTEYSIRTPSSSSVEFQLFFLQFFKIPQLKLRTYELFLNNLNTSSNEQFNILIARFFVVRRENFRVKKYVWILAVASGFSAAFISISFEHKTWQMIIIFENDE